MRLDAVEARHRETQRDRAEADRRHAEPAQDLKRSGEHRSSRPDGIDRYVRIGTPDGLAHRPDRIRHRSGCPRDDRDERLVVLRQRHVGQWPRIREDTAHVRIGGNAATKATTRTYAETIIDEFTTAWTDKVNGT